MDQANLVQTSTSEK